MRYCRNCRKWNADDPFRCRYCAAGLEGRLCPSGHVNPPDRNLSFCGDCGRPLEEKWGAGFSFKPYILAIGVGVMTLFLAILVAHLGHGAAHDPGQADAQLTTAIVVLVIIVLGFRLAFRILPPWLGKFVGETVTFFVQLVTGIKGKK